MIFRRLLLVFGLFTSAAAIAQQNNVLTLDRAVGIALERNSSVIQARNNVDGAHYATLAAYGGLLPDFSASYQFNRDQQWKNHPGVSVIDNQIVPNTPFSASNSYSAGVGGQWTLFNGFANTSNVSRAKATSNASELTLSRTEQTTIYQTQTLFLNVVRTSELLAVAQDNLKRSNKQLEQIVESNKVGAVALADVYREQVQVGNDELSVITAQNDFENAKADLVAFLGVSAEQEFQYDFTGIPKDIDTLEFTGVNAKYGNEAILTATALQKRPDYLATQETVNSSDASVTVARAGHWPSVTAQASYGFNGYDVPGGYNALPDNKSLNYSFNVSLPIFSGFATQNQVEQAQVTWKNAVEQMRQTDRQVRVDVQKALLALQASEKQVTVTQTSIQSASMDLQIAQEKYNLGAGTLLDLLVAHANYSTAMSNKVNAVTGYLLSKKQVEYSIGTIAQ
ncbi:MAG TPA: TolC family protein [Bacteroidota bacterium]|nr:TolC family protein [Bacteroidota bacterium]